MVLLVPTHPHTHTHTHTTTQRALETLDRSVAGAAAAAAPDSDAAGKKAAAEMMATAEAVFRRQAEIINADVECVFDLVLACYSGRSVGSPACVSSRLAMVKRRVLSPAGRVLCSSSFLSLSLPPPSPCFRGGGGGVVWRGVWRCVFLTTCFIRFDRHYNLLVPILRMQRAPKMDRLLDMKIKAAKEKFEEGMQQPEDGI